MDKIEFKIVTGEFGDETRIYINSRDLIEILKEYETPFALKEGRDSLAGSYLGLYPDMLYDHLTKPWNVDHIPILACGGCGEWGCWPMIISLEEKDDMIIWRGFKQPYRGTDSNEFWDFSEFPEFVFSKDNYRQELAKLSNK